MNHPKSIKLFLMDGEPNGRWACELSNLTGKAYKIPRIRVRDSSDREDLNNTGVYLLFGKDDNDNEMVYIGEAESILKRLNQQISQQDFWTEAVVFISKDDNLNKAHVKYIENRLFEIASSAKRYKIENSVTPTQSTISESDRAEMEEFIENMKLMVNTLGHKVFEQKVLQGSIGKSVFKIKAARGADAKGQPTSEGFVVFKGSKVASSIVESMTKSFVSMRERLIEKGVIVKNGDTYEIPEDYIFTSPSTAAVMVLGRNVNGLTEWKLADGRTLKEYESTSSQT
ncbi:GIY-YIG nuclease family protein [bacterium]|nr:GIY-YIG nuclease family protein [bacterium]